MLLSSAAMMQNQGSLLNLEARSSTIFTARFLSYDTETSIESRSSTSWPEDVMLNPCQGS